MIFERLCDPQSLNPEKAIWFDGLSEAVQIFAEACGLTARMWIGSDHYGYIEFETEHFESSAADTSEVRGFWRFLCENGDLNIRPGKGTVVMEFRFALYP